MTKTQHGPATRRAATHGALALTVLAGLVSQAYAQQQAADPKQTQQLDTVVVSGFRSSLAASAREKRDTVGLSDSIHAEDIGKFPDNNLAESISRVPGVQVNRDITGEGLNIQVRGLGSNFTRILLNGAPIASAGTSGGSASNANREVDLDFLPGDLFSRVTVSKSPTAGLLEGAIAGVVDMRTARPFDKQGTRGVLKLQVAKNDPANQPSTRGTALFSTTFGDTFGVLAGFSFARNRVATRGFEVGYVQDWITPRLANPSQSGITNSTAGTTAGAWGIPTTVPAAAAGTYTVGGVTQTLTAGQTIDAALLKSLNPGASIQQLDNGYVPRLPRPVNFEGQRDRLNGLLSVEFRPTEDFDGYIDLLLGSKTNKQERSDFNISVRNSGVIPMGMTYDRTDCGNYCFATGGTFLNSVGFLEWRRMDENTHSTSLTPGFEWRITDKWTLTAQGNMARSGFKRLAPTLLIPTNAATPFTTTIGHNGDFPVYTPSIDANDPKNFGWYTGGPTAVTASINGEGRDINTRGARWNLAWGDEKFTVKGGMAYDTYLRKITGMGDDGRWANIACGGNLNFQMLAPNNTGPNTCNGSITAANAAATNPMTQFPGYGTGWTAGKPPLAYLGSAVPDMSKYLVPGRLGFVNLDWARFADATHYYDLANNLIPATGNGFSGVSAQRFGENVFGSYIEVSGQTRIFDRLLRYDVGLRHTHASQIIGVFASTPDPRTTALPDGGTTNASQGARYPALVTETAATSSYNSNLPSGTVAYNVADDMIVRAAASKSITRANPSDLRPLTLTVNDVAFQLVSATNPNLKPFESKNLDLGWEWYTDKKGSYMAAAFFKKDIKNFPRTVTQQLTLTEIRQIYGANSITYAAGSQAETIVNASGGPDKHLMTLSQPVNTNDVMKLKGWELTWSQSLDRWLPWNGFGFVTNYTRTLQDPGTSGQVPIGVSPYTANLTVYFENSRGSIRLSNNYQAQSSFDTMASDGNNAFRLIKANRALFVMDLSTRLEIGDWVGWKKGVSINFDVANLGAAKQKSFVQEEYATRTYWDPGRTYQITGQMKF
ncbi:TonB-dependent receptor [Pelomonas cellulosilytica]|uniref:TonB-dependent receptor n=1 Tax=Pelomonas cellulosilytica TaxID=2906762 RepID=A0ABS8XX38_9BURK|nr:TonB-dependent receptor [Pelomonas sp. P8]MCE4556523.1 TonB-dependent receptor [Pelomonas sp. P8]